MATVNKKFRVLVVDDSSFMRKVLEGIFNADEQLQVVGNAKDGREAVAMAESLKPDVITMDINMPHVDGLQVPGDITPECERPQDFDALAGECPPSANFRNRSALSGSRACGVHRRTSYRNAHCAWIYRGLPCRCNSCTAHAGNVHNAICRAAR